MKKIAQITLEVREDEERFWFDLVYQDEKGLTGESGGVLVKALMKHEPRPGLAWEILEERLVNDGFKTALKKLKRFLYKKLEQGG